MKAYTFCFLLNFLKFLKLPALQELYYRTALGNVDVKEIQEFIEFKKSGVQSAETGELKKWDELITRARGTSNMMVISGDAQQIKYTLATCCNPIPGDEVFGFFSSDAQILIHRVNCSNAIKLLSNYAYRIVRAKWGNDQLISFLAGIRISGNDEIGMVNTITKIISNENNVNMRSIHFDTDDGLFEGTLMVYVHDTKHLNHLVQNLKKIKGVRMVERVGP